MKETQTFSPAQQEVMNLLALNEDWHICVKKDGSAMLADYMDKPGIASQDTLISLIHYLDEELDPLYVVHGFRVYRHPKWSEKK